MRWYEFGDCKVIPRLETVNVEVCLAQDRSLLIKGYTIPGKAELCSPTMKSASATSRASVVQAYIASEVNFTLSYNRLCNVLIKGGTIWDPRVLSKQFTHRRLNSRKELTVIDGLT